MKTEGQNLKSAIRLSAIWPQSAISSFGLLFAFALLCVTLSLISPYFLTLRNLTNVLAQGSINTVLAIGLTFVIIGGGIDLSVGSALALVGVVMAALVERTLSAPVAIAVGLLSGLTIGALNGLVVVRTRIPPFIVTLGTLSVARGLAFIFAGGRTIPVQPVALRVWGEGRLLGVPVPTIIAFALVVIAHVVLTRSVFGRHLFAIGGNERAAWIAGVQTGLTKWVSYLISGFAVFIGALISVGRLGSADPIRGEGYELDAIAAVIIGVVIIAAVLLDQMRHKNP